MTLEDAILQDLLRRKRPAPVTSIARAVQHPQKGTLRSILHRLAQRSVVVISVRNGKNYYVLKD